MMSNNNKELNKNSIPRGPNFTPRSSENHSYVNLNQMHTGDRPYSNTDSKRRHDNTTSIQPLTVKNVNKLPTFKIPPHNDIYSTPNMKTPKNWYSPPSSIVSDSRPPSMAGAKPYAHRDQPKLQTIDEDAALPIEKVIALCNHSNIEIQVNALAYLQHLVYNNNEKKMEVRNNNALRILVELTRSSTLRVANGALGVLKNMSFTEMEMITTDIERLGGLQRMVSIIKTTKDNFQKELAIDILWNLSVHYDLKSFIMTETLDTLLEFIIIPECKLMKDTKGNYVALSEELNWSIILRNALGIIRNISYESTDARIKLREVDGLVDCIFHLIFMAKTSEEAEVNIEQMSLIDSKTIENCVCILRNLTFAIQEIVDPTYLQSRNNMSSKSKNDQKKPTVLSASMKDNPKGIEMLWNAKHIVTALFPILKYGANAVTLEAAAGVIQNLSAGDWEPSQCMQVQFRLQLALPTLVDLIDIAPDEVIRSAATALRNLVREEFTCMLVGTNGLRTLTEQIPLNSRSKKLKVPALAAILSTIYAIIKEQEEFMKEFMLAKGVQRCINVRDSDEFINYDDDQHPDKVRQFCKFILQLLWKTPSAREILKKSNYKQSDIIPNKHVDPCNSLTPTKNNKITNNRYNTQDSVDSKNVNKHKYNGDSGFGRDSCSTMVSNPGLQQRNSRAYKTSNIPGYGQVKIPLNSSQNKDDTLSKPNVNIHNESRSHGNAKSYNDSPEILQKQENHIQFNSNYEYSKPMKSSKPTNKKGDSWV